MPLYISDLSIHRFGICRSWNYPPWTPMGACKSFKFATIRNAGRVQLCYLVLTPGDRMEETSGWETSWVYFLGMTLMVLLRVTQHLGVLISSSILKSITVAIFQRTFTKFRITYEGKPIIMNCKASNSQIDEALCLSSIDSSNVPDGNLSLTLPYFMFNINSSGARIISSWTS